MGRAGLERYLRRRAPRQPRRLRLSLRPVGGRDADEEARGAGRRLGGAPGRLRNATAARRGVLPPERALATLVLSIGGLRSRGPRAGKRSATNCWGRAGNGPCPSGTTRPRQPAVVSTASGRDKTRAAELGTGDNVATDQSRFPATVRPPPSVQSAPPFIGSSMPLAVGTRLGPYDIVAPDRRRRHGPGVSRARH